MNVQIINKSKHQTPAYETEGSAGMDLRANIDDAIVLKPLERVIVKLDYLLLYLMDMKLK